MASGDRYLPAARRCQRVRFNIFLCFFFRIRLRRFLMSDPMAGGTLAELRPGPPVTERRPARHGSRSAAVRAGGGESG